ncbi:MAG: helix-turn-helix domain-containing protein [bacterium]
MVNNSKRRVKLMNRVKKEREKRNWSQFQLAKKANINQGDISQIENGKIFPYPGWRKRLAEALGVEEQYLFPEINKSQEVS